VRAYNWALGVLVQLRVCCYIKSGKSFANFESFALAELETEILVLIELPEQVVFGKLNSKKVLINL
jgi:hypothetical protein